MSISDCGSISFNLRKIINKYDKSSRKRNSGLKYM